MLPPTHADEGNTTFSPLCGWGYLTLKEPAIFFDSTSRDQTIFAVVVFLQLVATTDLTKQCCICRRSSLTHPPPACARRVITNIDWTEPLSFFGSGGDPSEMRAPFHFWLGAAAGLVPVSPARRAEVSVGLRRSLQLT